MKKKKMDCPLYKRSKEYLDHLCESQKIPSTYFDPRGDKCYETCCYNELNIYERGGQIYEMPIKAVRFGLSVPERKDKENIFNWNNSYHATDAENLRSFLENGPKLPGEKIGDKKVEILSNHCQPIDKNDNRFNYFFSSPSFAYVCSRAYSQEKKFKGEYYFFSFQLRQKKGTYIIQDQTLSPDNLVKDRYVEHYRQEFKTVDLQNVAIIGVIIYEVSSKGLLPHPLLIKDSLSNILISPLDMENERSYNESIKLSRKYIYNKFPNIDNFILEYIKDLQSFVDSIDLFDANNIRKKIKKRKIEVNLAKCATSAVSICGSVVSLLSFPIPSLVLGGIALVSSAGIGIGDYFKKENLQKPIKEKEKKYTELMEKKKQMDEILQFVYHQIFNLFQGNSTNEKNIKETLSSIFNIFQIAGSVGGEAASVGYEVTKNAVEVIKKTHCFWADEKALKVLDIHDLALSFSYGSIILGGFSFSYCLNNIITGDKDDLEKNLDLIEKILNETKQQFIDCKKQVENFNEKLLKK